MNKKKISIVIVNYNGKNLLENLLNSIAKSNYKNYEIIVVDNSSSDGSCEFIKKKNKEIKLVENKKNLGYSGINSALKFCNGEYILFLNNDMKIDKDCIGNLIKVIKSDKNIAMSAPKLVNFYGKNMKSGGTWVSRAFYNGHIKSENKDVMAEIPYLGVGLIKKEFVDMYGYLFDPDYFIYGEDLDLGLRIRLNGKKVMFVPDAVMHHMHAITTQKTSRAFMTFLMERNLLTTFFKIFSFKNIILFLPYVLAMRLFAMLRDLAKLNFGNLFSRIRAILWIILNPGIIIKKRNEAQKFRKASDKYVLKVFNEKYLFRKPFII